MTTLNAQQSGLSTGETSRHKNDKLGGLFKSRSLIGVIFFVIGASAMYVLKPEKIQPKPEIQSLGMLTTKQSDFLNHFFDDKFFKNSGDPFEEMRRMRDAMERDFSSNAAVSGFDTWFGNRFGGSAGEIERREDDKFIYYDVHVADLKNDRVEVKTADGQITITGQLTKKAEGLSVNSTFERSFPAPENADLNHMEMTQEQNKIVVKFPKKIPSK